MIHKFNKLKHKTLFYTEVSVETLNSLNTVKTAWFNKTKGFNIPDCKLYIVTQVLDRRLKIEKRQREIEEVIKKLEPIKK
jgi:hypothetical protein